MTIVLPEVLTVAEAAKALKLSESRVHQLIRAGTLPTARVVEHGQHRVLVSDVARLLEPERRHP